MRKTKVRSFLVAAGVSLALAFTLSCSGEEASAIEGIDGNHGKDGVDGKDGADGIDGNHGVDGKDGVDGNHGNDGKDGEDGNHGNHGEPGEKGEAGEKGEPGANGKDGEPGANGKDGEPGANGKDGTDCEVGSDGAYFVMKCGGVEKARWPKAMCGAVAYAPEESLCSILKDEDGKDEDGLYLKHLCGKEYYYPETHKCSKDGVVLSIICGGNKFDPEEQQVCDGDSKNGIVKYIFTDTRDGQEYKYVKIGEQTWMAENLNYAKEGKEGNSSRCYNDDESECDINGRLYRFDPSDPLDWLDVCPLGWHVPKQDEWLTLLKFAGSNEDDCSTNAKCTGATKLIAKSGWLKNDGTPASYGTDDYGFSLLPASGHNGNTFNNNLYGKYGFYWTSSNWVNNQGVVQPDRWMMMNFGSSNYFSNENLNKWIAVRCIQSTTN